MPLAAHLLPLAALAGAACATPPGLLDERAACDRISIPLSGQPISHERLEYDGAGRLIRRVCDGCDGWGMDARADDIEQITRDGVGLERREKVSSTGHGPAFAVSEITTDEHGCPVQRRFWKSTPQDWALDQVTCDEEGRQVATVEDLERGEGPGRARTLRYDRRGRLEEELFDRDMDGDFEERTRWRYGRWRLPIRRDWYLNQVLVARSDYDRGPDGVLLVERYDYLVDGNTEVTVLYGYGCGAP
ncbi:MAG: hypothetical protein ABIO70_02730 [Pseudomonadota bacterium]